ncbi:MAG: HK97 gp10 family phage protein [Oscillospiraceae bacterium]|nr:HK97 gp10 family phage protein [Oscillospiraceae bacterium]
MIRVDVGAIKQTAIRLRGAADSALNGLALEVAEYLAQEAEASTPIDTGKLRAAWVAEETGPLTAQTRNPVPYASFVEFDTRHWISGQTVPGQRFLRDAIEGAEAALPDLAETRLEEVIRRCFDG